MLNLSNPTPPAPPPPSLFAPEDSPAAPAPPLDWEAQPAFREVFLMHHTRPEDRAALEHLGSMLYESALEMSDKWPDWPENPTQAELRAVAVDLRHAAAFLASVGKERKQASLGMLEESLSLRAEKWAIAADRIGAEIEALLRSGSAS